MPMDAVPLQEAGADGREIRTDRKDEPGRHEEEAESRLGGAAQEPCAGPDAFLDFYLCGSRKLCKTRVFSGFLLCVS